MEKRILQVRKLSDALRVRLKELKKSDADLLLNLDEEELSDPVDMYKGYANNNSKCPTRVTTRA